MKQFFKNPTQNNNAINLHLQSSRYDHNTKTKNKRLNSIEWKNCNFQSILNSKRKFESSRNIKGATMSITHSV